MFRHGAESFPDSTGIYWLIDCGKPFAVHRDNESRYCGKHSQNRQYDMLQTVPHFASILFVLSGENLAYALYRHLRTPVEIIESAGVHAI